MNLAGLESDKNFVNDKCSYNLRNRKTNDNKEINEGHQLDKFMQKNEPNEKENETALKVTSPDDTKISDTNSVEGLEEKEDHTSEQNDFDHFSKRSALFHCPEIRHSWLYCILFCILIAAIIVISIFCSPIFIQSNFKELKTSHPFNISIDKQPLPSRIDSTNFMSENGSSTKRPQEIKMNGTCLSDVEFAGVRSGHQTFENETNVGISTKGATVTIKVLTAFWWSHCYIGDKHTCSRNDILKFNMIDSMMNLDFSELENKLRQQIIRDIISIRSKRAILTKVNNVVEVFVKMFDYIISD